MKFPRFSCMMWSLKIRGLDLTYSPKNSWCVMTQMCNFVTIDLLRGDCWAPCVSQFYGCQFEVHIAYIFVVFNGTIYQAFTRAINPWGTDWETLISTSQKQSTRRGGGGNSAGRQKQKQSFRWQQNKNTNNENPSSCSMRDLKGRGQEMEI